jgi:hypothetical protein
MKPKRIVIGSVLVLMMAIVTAFYVPAEHLVFERKWSIEWGQQATWLKLRKYELIGRPEELRTWLQQIDGAPGQEAAVIFLSWGLDNQHDFVSILEGLDIKRKAEIFNLLGSMIVERGMKSSFRQSFSGVSSDVVNEILMEVDRIKDANRR